MKVLGAAFVTLMRMQSSNTPRLCRESCSTRVRGKLAFAPTTAGRDGWLQHCACGSRLMQAKNR
jgi:hypothetical protein